MATGLLHYATGRRKVAAARVWLGKGKGNVQVNARTLQDYFPREVWCKLVEQPLEATGLKDQLDIRATVRGGGLSGQAGALRHGIARALLHHNGELRALLKKLGFLTRDDRMVERKKYGQPGARKHFQYSKR